MLHWTFVCTLMIFLVWTREDWQARIIILCFMHLPFWPFSGSYFISISGCWPSSWGGNQPCHPFALHVLLILPQALQGKWLYSLPACFLSKWPQDLFNITLFLPHCQLTTDYASRTLKGAVCTRLKKKNHEDKLFSPRPPFPALFTFSLPLAIL